MFSVEHPLIPKQISGISDGVAPFLPPRRHREPHLCCQRVRAVSTDGVYEQRGSDACDPAES